MADGRSFIRDLRAALEPFGTRLDDRGRALEAFLPDADAHKALKLLLSGVSYVPDLYVLHGRATVT